MVAMIVRSINLHLLLPRCNHGSGPHDLGQESIRTTSGPFLGRMFLVLIDAHSKWIEVFCVTSATSSATMECLRHVFTQFGIPETLVTDNGACFTSEEFEAFLKANGVRHII